MAYILKEKLWYTADKSKAVKDGDPKSAFLIGPKGFVISDDEAERLDLVKIERVEVEQTEGSAVFSKLEFANGETPNDDDPSTNDDDPSTNDDVSESNNAGDEKTAVGGDEMKDKKSEEAPKENKAILPPENKRQKAKPRTKREPATKKGS